MPQGKVPLCSVLTGGDHWDLMESEFTYRLLRADPNPAPWPCRRQALMLGGAACFHLQSAPPTGQD